MSKFLAGVVIGLAAGLLLAPDSGENTRENLSDTADKWKGKLDKLLGKTEAELDDLKVYLDKNIHGLTDDVKRKILTILDEVEEMAYNPRG